MGFIHELQQKYHLEKPNHFFDLYERYIKPESCRKILEIGVSKNSVAFWKEYFPNAEIFGLDCTEKAAEYAEDRVKILVGNQKNMGFLDREVLPNGPFDLIMDDGGHYMDEQMVAFRRLYNSVAKGGWYAIEDLGSSYWPNFGGGYGNPNTTISLLKSVIDQLNFSYHDVRFLDFPYVESMHFHDSICFVEKKSNF